MIGEKTSGGLAWRRSKSCANTACVEVAELENGGAAVRDSKQPDGPVLEFTASEWSAFRAGMKNGEFDFA